MNFKLSIITINLNNDLGLLETIESVVNQTFTDYEYIIIDGGSTDKSVGIIKKYSDKINYWISEPDKGIYNAMNKGIKVTNGEYVIFMNSGDYFYNNNVLENVFKENINADVIYGNLIRVENENLKELVEFPSKMTFLFFQKVGLCQQATFVRTKLHASNPFDEDYKIFADRKFFIQTLFENKTFRFVNQIICYNDANGFSNAESSRKIAIKEKERLENELIPKIIRDDYIFLYRINKLFTIVDYLQKYPRLRQISYYILYPVYKIYSLFQKVKK